MTPIYGTGTMRSLIGTAGRVDVDAVVAKFSRSIVIDPVGPLVAADGTQAYGYTGIAPALRLVRRVKRLFPHLSLREAIAIAEGIESC